MRSAQVFRLIEGSLVVLFFMQAARVAFATLLGAVSNALDQERLEMGIVYAHLVLVAALVLSWFAPRARSALPETLSISAILIALARVVASVQAPSVRYYASLAIIGLAGLYFVSLLRANRRSWLSVMAVGLVLDQLLRARDTYDLSLRTWHELFVGDQTLLVPWFAIQIALSAMLVAVSRLARSSARHEPYEPASLTTRGGLALGCFFALEILVLSTPSVMARWARFPYSALVPWVLLATVLVLAPAVRVAIGRTLAIFDDWLRGWVWLFAFVLMILVGNRLSGAGAAAALVIAQLIAMFSLWWIPGPSDPYEVEQVGPSFSLGLFVFVGLVYVYGLTFHYNPTISLLRDQGLIVIIAAAVLLGSVRIWWREDDPWLASIHVPRGVPLTFIVPLVIFGLILSSLAPAVSVPVLTRDTIRVATYNINGGYDADGIFQLELIARTIEAGLVDVIVLQEVDTGSPLSYNVDEVEFIARRLGMNHVYLPTVEQVHGIAVLSRWPIISQGGQVLGEQQLAALRALVQSQGRSVVIIGAQLAPADEEQRLAQLGVLLGLGEDATPVIVAADLGAAPDDVVYRQLVAEGFLDPDLVLGVEGGFTTPARSPTVRHDYVLVKGLVPIDARQVDSTASDHRLVVVEAGWPP